MVVPTTTHQYKRAVGLFYSRDEAEQALRALKDASFNMDRVSLIARNAVQIDTAGAVEEGNAAGEGATAGAVSGGVLGGITGLLAGLGTLAIPGIGPIVFVGAEISALTGLLAGGVTGAIAGGIIGALVGLGIPEDRAKMYSDRVKGGSYLVMVSGLENEVRQAEPILRDHGIEEFEIYDATDLGNTIAQPTDRSTAAATQANTQKRVAAEPNTHGDPDVIIVDERAQTRQPGNRR